MISRDGLAGQIVEDRKPAPMAVCTDGAEEPLGVPPKVCRRVGQAAFPS